MIESQSYVLTNGHKTTGRVPLIKPDLPTFDAVADGIREMLESGQITNFGKYVRLFEAEAGAFLGTEVVTVSSGTSGLILTLQALGVGPGSRVILPSFTFMATAQAIRYAGGIPVFAEIEEDLTLSPSDLELLLDQHEDVAAVIPVHTYGLPAQVDEIARVVEAAGTRRSRPIAVLYDAAHGFGAALADGRRVGGFGNAEVFSLSATKLLVSIEGGMISTRDRDLAHRLRKMRNYGIEANYDAHFPGVNGKMSELHAIVGLYNLRRISDLIAEREWRARAYAARIRHTRPSASGGNNHAATRTLGVASNCVRRSVGARVRAAHDRQHCRCRHRRIRRRPAGRDRRAAGRRSSRSTDDGDRHRRRVSLSDRAAG
jgi:dTDP-4-amino-4,6-dideoxygalactose transaminase